MSDHTYTLKICGLERELQLVEVSPGLKIASFVILGDTELVCRVAPEIVKRLPPLDILITAEAKGIPLVFEISRLLGTNYLIARKSVKPYMKDPLVDRVVSITTQKEQMLCLDGKDAQAVRGKRVAIIDDVISTGESVNALERLISKAGGTVVAKAAILAEGDASKLKDIIYLQELPLFPTEK
ncbi:MAG: phosphoribosyltransferase family protein [Syntrophomonadaceae bacterium]